MDKLNNYLFKKIHSNNLIYNTCWEDPRCDRALLDLNQTSKILMITSAGCNALEYLLDDVEAIHCVDMNYRQNAVLALKIALIKHGDFDLLFRFFGEGHLKNASELYKRHLRGFLKEEYQNYWDKKISYFNGKGIRKSFYYKGSSGLLAFCFTSYIKLRPRLKEKISSLMRSMRPEEQMQIYSEVKDKMFSPFLDRLLHSQLVLNLAGVPSSQTQLFQREYRAVKGGYIGASLDRVFENNPVKDNYFYSVYFNGKYDKERCPEYLKEKNFQTLRDRVDRIEINTNSLEAYCRSSSEQFSHLILLDHMDWLAQNDPEGLLSEWKTFLKCSSKNAKVLFRSAAQNLNWLPDAIRAQIHFEENTTDRCIEMDRVGTYNSTWVGTIHQNPSQK